MRFRARVVEVDRPAARLLLFLVVGRQVRTDRFPGRSGVGRLEQDVAAVVDDLGIRGRHQDRRIPVEPVQLGVCAFAARPDRIRLDVTLLLIAHVDRGDVTEMTVVVDAIRIAGIRHGVLSVRHVAEAHPIAFPDADLIPFLIRPAPDFVILKTTQHVVWLRHVQADVVRLRHWHVVHEVPIAAVVVGDEEAAIGSAEQPFRIQRIYPQRVVIAEHASARRAERPPAIGRHVERAAHRVDPVLVLRIDADLCVVKRPIVDAALVVDGLPVEAAIVRAPQDALFLRFDQGVHDCGIAPADRDADPPDQTRARQPVVERRIGEPRPGHAAVRRSI